MNASNDWPHRLLTLRRARSWDQAEMASALGVTREWVSRLERGRGEFSELVKLKVRELEGVTSDHVRLSTHGAVDEMENVVRERVEKLLTAADGEQQRLSWIIEQMQQHLDIPPHWRKHTGPLVPVTLPSQTQLLSSIDGKPLAAVPGKRAQTA